MLFLLLFPLFTFAGSLDGLWVQDCANGYQRQEFFQGAHAEYSEFNFWDKKCTQFSVQTISRGEISMGARVVRPANSAEINFEFLSVHIKPRDARTAAYYNERRLCGFKDWKVDEEMEVTGRECDFFGLGSVVKIPSKGDKKFGVVSEGLDSLFFGRLTPERDGSSSSRRPIELDLNPYRRIYFP